MHLAAWYSASKGSAIPPSQAMDVALQHHDSGEWTLVDEDHEDEAAAEAHKSG